MADPRRRAGDLTLRHDRPVALIVALTLATFVTAMDNTVVNVALPHIRAALRLSTSDLEWVAASYLLVFASLMIPGGRLADRCGRRRTLVAGLLVFGCASLAAALASTAVGLVSARAVQGLGAALILPASLAALAVDVPPQRRNVAAGAATAAAASALALGPVVGGILTQSWTWHAIFYVNLPIVALTIALLCWALPNPQRGDADVRLHLPAMTLLGAAMACLTWLLIDGRSHAGVSGVVTAGGLFCAAAFVVAERRAGWVVIDRVLLGNRRFSRSVLVQTLWGLAINGVFFYTSLYLQDVLRLSPSRAGLTFVPLAIALAATVPLLGAAQSRLGERGTIAFGLLLVAAGLCWVSTIGRGAHPADMVPPLVAVGVGSGMTIPLTTLAMAASAQTGSAFGSAAALMTAARELAGVLGIAVLGVVIAIRSNTLVAAGASAQSGFLGGYRVGLLAAAAVSVLGAVIAALLPRADDLDLRRATAYRRGPNRPARCSRAAAPRDRSWPHGRRRRTR